MSRTIILIQSSADQMLTYLFLCTFLFCWSVQFCAASDTLATGASINSTSGETLLSAGKIFELGFFIPDHNRSTYLCIWYYMWKPKVIVWVANRDSPLPDPADGFFRMDDYGNLVLSDRSRKTYFSTGLLGRLNSSRSVKLLDSGNLVLTDDSSEKSKWQSFDHPTDTFLPGMNMYKNLNLTSQTSDDDPRSGSYSLKQHEDDNRTFVIWKTSNMHWISGESDEFNSYTEMPKGVEAMLANFSNVIGGSPRRFVPSGNMTYISYSNNFTSSVSEYKYTRIVMNSSGEIQFWNMSSLKWSAPGDVCSVYNQCGNFGSCNGKTRPPCKCFPGFKRSSPDTSEDTSAGCTRKSDITMNDTFLSLKMMRVGKPASPIDSATNETSCREKCLQNLECKAYSYVKPSINPQVHTDRCWVWKTDLSNLEEEYAVGGHDLYVRVAASDIGSTSRCCKPCGAYLIPYPLSTGSNCGDPLYSSFNCSNSTGQVSFKTLNGIHQVSSINPETRTFLIQVKDACNNSEGNILQLNQSLPFHVTNSCSINHSAIPSSSLSLEVPDEVEITWNLPSEPLCTSSAECVNWPNSICHAREDGKRRCLCNASYRWDGLNLNCTQGDGSSHKSLSNSAKAEIISMVVIIGVSLLCSISYFSYKRRLMRKRRESMQGSQSIRMYDTERRVKNLIDTGEFKEEDKKGIDVPFYDLESILEATDYFSDANKLGQGGFGPVYKSTFGGQEIAVKRLSSHSGQGLEEFKNEVVLIAKLQHRNLVRLQGYCIKGDEKILLYEYMRNKSLDAFIFDRTRCLLLDWEKRFDIIMGIARGLLYLHQDSRLRIIHRDLKTGNILLDDEMNPKISDFGLARIVGGKETEANTVRVVGTYGYMSPEYALEGLFSVKSDVFSFGVIVLEIVSGKRNTGFYQSHQGMNLLSYAWRLWKEEKALDLMDLTLLESCNRCEVLKCIIVGLLCVQEDPSHRPNMSNVVFMLGSETATLPIPKEPAFVARKWISTQPSTSSSKPDTCSVADTTISAKEGR